MTKATHQLHDAGQNICLDDITHALLTGGSLECYIRGLGARAHFEPDHLRPGDQAQ